MMTVIWTLSPNDLNSEPRILVSGLTQRRRISYLKINLVGTRSKRNSLGAQVTLSTGTLKITKSQIGSLAIYPKVFCPCISDLGT